MTSALKTPLSTYALAICTIEDEKRQVYSRSALKLEILHQPVILLPTTGPVTPVSHRLFLLVMHLWDYLKSAQVTKDRTKERRAASNHPTGAWPPLGLLQAQVWLLAPSRLTERRGMQQGIKWGSKWKLSGDTYRGPRQTRSRDITLLVEM